MFNSKHSTGIGRSGKFYNIKERAIPDWEKEEILIENENKLKSAREKP